MKSFYLLFALLIAGCSTEESKLRIAAAANTRYMMEELVKKFEAENNIDCELIFGSSGKLTAQLIEGAPYDLFFSADLNYANQLKKELSLKNEVRQYASGQLVLWSTTLKSINNLNILTSQSVHKIGLPNPISAPYGRAAEEVIEKTIGKDAVESKLIYGESIGQTNQFIISGSVTVGFTSLSTIKSDQAKDKGVYFLIDSDLYEPISQGMIITATGSKQETWAREFEKFIFSPKGKTIISAYGYL